MTTPVLSRAGGFLVAAAIAISAPARAVDEPPQGLAFGTLNDTLFGPSEFVIIDVGSINCQPDDFFGGCTQCPPPGQCDSAFCINITARVYVVPGGCIDNDEEADLDAFAVVPPNVIVQPTGTSGFINQVIAITAPDGTLGDGFYDVVIDECEDGTFHPGQDAIIASFTVSGADGFPPGAELNPAIAQFKQQAVASVAAAAEDEARFASFRSGLEAVAAVETLVGLLQNPVGGAIAVYLNYGIDQGVDTVLQGPGGGLGPGFLGPKLQSFLLDGVERSLEGRRAGYQAIVDDPPDPAFLETVVLPAIELVVADDPGELARAAAEAANAGAVRVAALEALLAAMEKFQGADLADDDDGRRKQALAIAEFTELAAVWAEREAAATVSFGALLDSLAIDRSEGLAWLAEAQGRLTPDGEGFTAAEQRLFDGFGLPPEALPILAQAILAVETAVDPIDAFVARAAGAEDRAAADAGDLAAFGTVAVGEADNLLYFSPHEPAASAGGPYSAPAGTLVTLDATGSVDLDTDFSALDFAWDLDLDGVFDDAFGPTVTTSFAAPAATLVAVRVADPDGFESVDHALVEVTEDDLPPSAIGTPTVTRLLSLPDGVVGFDVQAEDPEGDAVAYAWRVNGADAGVSGTSFAWSPTTGDRGLNRIEAIAADGDPGSPDATVGWAVLVADRPVASIGASGLDFGRVAVGETASATLEIVNEGTVDLAVLEATVAGSAAFAAVTPLPVIVAPGESGALELEFAPVAPGAAVGTLELLTDDIANEEPVIELAGVGGAEACPEDLDGSGAVDFGDLLEITARWGACDGCDADLDDSGVVDFADLLILLGAWGPC